MKGAITALLFASSIPFWFPRWEAYRDARYYEPLEDVESVPVRIQKQHPLPYYEYIPISHSESVMSKTYDGRGVLGDPETTIFCETSHLEKCTLSNGRVLLIPATVAYSEIFYAPVQGAPNDTSLVSLILENEMCVTVCDKRGHGRSKKNNGTYTAQLFAADMAAAMEHLHSEEDYHVMGYSVGGGAAFSMAVLFPAHVKSATSLGFALDSGKTAGWLQYIFSRRFVNRMFGLEFAMWSCEIVMQPRKGSGRMVDYGRRTPMVTFLETSSAWDGFNLLDQAVANLTRPVTHLRPEHDVATTQATVEFEHSTLRKANPSLKHSLVSIPGYGHLVPAEPGGPKVVYEAFMQSLTNMGFEVMAPKDED